MKTPQLPSPPVFRLLGTLMLIGLCAVILGCGSGSDSSGETVEENLPSAEEKREEQENQQAKRELEEGDYVDCGGQVFVNKKTFCTFAKNMHKAYYVEVVSGGGKVVGLYPKAGQDYRVYCSGTIPHKCTGFKDDGAGIEPLHGAVIFFSP
jgi:hypothetical protein